MFCHWSAVFRIGSRRSEAAGAGARPGQVHPEETQAESQAEDTVHHAAAALPGEKVSRKAVPNHRRTSGILVVPSPYGNAGETPSKLSFQSRTINSGETFCKLGGFGEYTFLLIVKWKWFLKKLDKCVNAKRVERDHVWCHRINSMRIFIPWRGNINIQQFRSILILTIVKVEMYSL